MEESDKNVADVCGVTDRHELKKLYKCVLCKRKKKKKKEKEGNSTPLLSSVNDQGGNTRRRGGKESLLAVIGHTFVIVTTINSIDASIATTMLLSGPKRSHYAEQAQVGVVLKNLTQTFLLAAAISILPLTLQHLTLCDAKTCSRSS